MNPRTFEAPWSASLKWISGTATALMLGVGVVLLTAVPQAGSIPWPAMLVAAVPLCALPFRVLGYRLEGAVLFVRRPGWTTRIDLSGLVSAEAAPELAGKSWRVCGNGGLFSFTGWFHARGVGTYRAWFNDPAKVVLLHLPGRRIAVSPGDPSAFIQTLRQAGLPRH